MAISQQQAQKVLQERGINVQSQEDVPLVRGAGPVTTGVLGGLQELRRLGRNIAQQAGPSPQQAQALGIGPSLLRPVRPLVDPKREAARVGAGIGDVGGFAALATAGQPEDLGSLLGPLARTAGQAALGSAMAPQGERGVGAALGGLGGALGEAGPVVRKIGQFASPQKLTDSIMGYLKGGRSVEENAKSFAGDVKNSFETKKGEASALYKPLFDSVGDSSIYDGVTKSPTSYSNLPKNISDSYLPDIQKLHNNFIKTPNLQNAHDLQSQLGFEIRRLNKQPVRSIADTREMQNWTNARNALHRDVDTSLNTKDPTGDLSKMYSGATDFYRDNVVPYLSNRGIAKIARGQVTNPRNIGTLFKHPDEDVGKVVNDLGDEGKKKILFSEIGKRPNITPETLNNEVSKLEGKGLSSYITPNLQEQLDKMPSRLATRTALQRGAGVLGGLAFMPAAAGMAPEALAGIGGAAITPAIMRALQHNLPVGAIGRGVGRALPAARTAAVGLGIGALPGARQAPAAKQMPARITKEAALKVLRERGQR